MKSLWWLILLAAGCLKPTPNSGAIICGPGASCLDDYYCEPVSRTCWKNGESPSPADLSVPDDLTPVPKALGEPCSAGGDCANHQCVDGICCAVAASACTGCRACNVAGSLGQCANVPGGSDPHGACINIACAAGCDGAGACAPAMSSTICLVSSCSIGAAYGQSASTSAMGTQCTGTTSGSCGGAMGSGSCPGNLICSDGMSCKASCVGDGDCVTGFYCSAGACNPKVALLGSCTRDGECASLNVCASGKCRQCAVDRDCAQAGKVCRNNACVVCQSNQDCITAGIGDTCNGGCWCSGPSSVNCKNSNGPACQPVNASVYICGCLMGSFVNFCDRNSACVGQTCKLLAGVACYKGGDCVSGVCTNGVCQ